MRFAGVPRTVLFATCICWSAVGKLYNAATSVNFPTWVIWYVREALPLVIQVQEWPADYMAGMLAEWLQHHQKLLQVQELWQPHAAQFVRQHPTR